MKYLAPVPKQFVDQSGIPLSDGHVYVYIHGDTQLANVYQDADGTALLPNPVPLDSNGAWVGFVTAGVPLDIIVKDAGGNVQFPYQKVVAGAGVANVAIEPVVTSGTKIAECWVDGELLELFAPPGGGIQADWDESDPDDPSYIKNKPTIPAAQVQSDWDQADASKVDYIKNKPSIPSYSAGTGIKIQGNTISADTVISPPAWAGTGSTLAGVTNGEYALTATDLSTGFVHLRVEDVRPHDVKVGGNGCVFQVFMFGVYWLRNDPQTTVTLGSKFQCPTSWDDALVSDPASTLSTRQIEDIEWTWLNQDYTNRKSFAFVFDPAGIDWDTNAPYITIYMPPELRNNLQVGDILYIDGEVCVRPNDRLNLE